MKAESIGRLGGNPLPPEWEFRYDKSVTQIALGLDMPEKGITFPVSNMVRCKLDDESTKIYAASPFRVMVIQEVDTAKVVQVFQLRDAEIKEKGFEQFPGSNERFLRTSYEIVPASESSPQMVVYRSNGKAEFVMAVVPEQRAIVQIDQMGPFGYTSKYPDIDDETRISWLAEFAKSHS